MVLAIGLIAVALKLVGWRENLFGLDRLTQVYDAIAFLKTGKIPVLGNVSSFGSFISPGTTWLLVPGVALFNNPSLIEPPSFMILFIGTLFGIYLLVEPYAGKICALFAVSLFAFSSAGIYFATTGSGYGHPFFPVWSVYFAWQWVRQKKGRFLAASILVWGIGMYIFMVIAPFILVYPLLWLIYRPPVRIGPLLVAGAVLLIVWFPYLQYDFNSGFTNLISQFTQKSIMPADFEKSWNDPGLRAIFEQQSGGLDLSGKAAETVFNGPMDVIKWLGIKIAGRISVITLGLTSNFRISTGNYFLNQFIEVTISLASLLAVLSAMRGEIGARFGFKIRAIFVPPSALLTVGGFLLLAVGLIVNEIVLQKFISRDGHLWWSEISIIRQFQTAFIAAGLLVLLRNPLSRFIRLVDNRIHQKGEEKDLRKFLTFLGIVFLVPFLLLIVLTKPGIDRRFLWLWPFQSIFVAVFFVHVVPGIIAAKRIQVIAGVLFFAVLSYKPIIGSLDKWSRDGYAGREGELIQAVSFVGNLLNAERRTSASIGYNVPFSGYNISYNIVDSRYKVGAMGDFILWWSYKIKNENKSAEGALPQDEFRIVTAAPRKPTMSYYILPPDSGFEEIGKFGDYRVLRREDANKAAS